MKSRAFLQDDETADRIGPYLLIQKKGKRSGQRFTEDPVLLVDFIAPLKPADAVIDIGSGTGVIPLLLAWKTSVEKIIAVEILETRFALMKRTVELNGLSGRIEPVLADYRSLQSRYPEGSFSVVVSNPPYLRQGEGRPPLSEERRAARSEVFGGLDDLLRVSRHLAGRDGRIFYSFPVRRQTEMLKGLERLGIERRRLKTIDRPAGNGIFLIEAARKGLHPLHGVTPFMS